MPTIPEIDLSQLFKDLAQLERNGTNYGLGAKAPSLSCAPSEIKAIDCSGYVRWALARATGGALKIPDGSQNQRDWAEKNLRQVGSYSNCARYMTDKRLFIAFIRPHHNGCGPVGHVWLLAKYDDGDNGTLAGTLESHGGQGPNSRRWNTPVLLREVYSCFELPCKP